MKPYKGLFVIILIILTGLSACGTAGTDKPSEQPSEPPLISALTPTPPTTPVPTPTITPAPTPTPINVLPLTEADFIVEYKGFTITPDTTFEALVETLGYGDEEYYKKHNYTIGNTEVLNLFYPDGEYTGIRVCFHKNSADNFTCISFVELLRLSNGNSDNARGLVYEDTKQKVVDLFGEPDEIVGNAWQYFCSYKYYLGEKYLEILLANENVYSIKICCNPERPKQQGDPFNGLKTFSVKFYDIDVNDFSATVKNNEEISAADFVADTVKFFNLHYGTQINNIWYESNRIYVDLNRIEELGFNIGSTGSAMRVQELIMTLSSFPNVEEIEVLISGEKGRYADHYGFNGIYKVRDEKWEWDRE